MWTLNSSDFLGPFCLDEAWTATGKFDGSKNVGTNPHGAYGGSRAYPASVRGEHLFGTTAHLSS